MTLTLQSIEAHIRNALGGDSSVEGNGRSIANQAGHYWASMHPWRCMERVGRLTLRAPITVADGTWTESSRTLTLTAAFTNYTWVQGDEIEITAGTSATLGIYRIQSKSSSDAIVLETSIGSAANGSTDIDGTLDLASCALPSNFREMIGRPWGTDNSSSWLYMEMVNADEMRFLRSGTSLTGGFSYYGAIQWVPSAAVNGGAPIPRLELFRAPEANELNAFEFNYRADWEDLSNDDDIAGIPSMFAMEMLYLQIARAVALGYEEHDISGIDDRLAKIVGGATYLAAINADGGITPSVGRITGGAAAHYHAQERSWHGNDVVVDWP